MTIHGMHVTTPETGWCTAPVKHYRLWDCGVTWRHINPAPGVYDWSRLDSIVSQAIQNGAQNLTYVLGATPQWLAREPELPNYAPWLGPGSNSAPFDMAYWTAFIDLLVRRYDGRIGSYEVWNEPQLKDFWGYDSWTVLATMTELAYNTIHAASSTAKVVSGAVLPRASSGGMTRGGKYLAALKTKGWPVDIYASHIYPEIGKTPGAWKLFAQDWQAKLTELAAPAKPKWVTETNMNLKGGPLSDAGIADYMPRIDQICKDEGIFKVYWYCWQHGDPQLLGIPFTPTSQGTASLTQLLAVN